MKKTTFTQLFMVYCLGVSAQGLNIGVIVPQEIVDGVSSNAWSILGTKLETMITTCGATSVNSGNIVLFPVFNYVGEKLIEGGMRNIYSVEFELTAKAVSLSTNTSFGSITWKLRGNGYSKSEAVADGMNKLSTDDPLFVSFFTDIRKKIETYYISNHGALIAQAKALAIQGQYGEAISVLYEYPYGITGYNEVQSTLGTIYKKYQTDNCSQILQEARAKYAVQDYETAIALIADIDATSSCATEAKVLTNQIRQRIISNQTAERAYELEEKKIAASIEKTRIKAISNMVSSYYKSRPRVTYNTMIIRHW